MKTPNNLIIFPQKLVTVTFGELVKDFERDYFNRRKRTPKSETTWDKDYRLTFEKLPLDSKVNVDDVLQLVKSRTKPDSKSRKRYCMALGALCKFGGVNIDLKSLAGNYSTKSVNPRDIPSDEDVYHNRLLLTSEQWQWAYGMIACYGLRPHEVFNLNLERVRDGDICLEILDGKTGARIVYPFPLDWYHDWELSAVKLPTVSGRSNSDLGRRLQQAFRRAQMPFRAYDLRHAWAIRAMESGLHQTLAAQQMGHSVVVHTQVYQRWISEREHQRAYERLMGNRAGSDFVHNR